MTLPPAAALVFLATSPLRGGPVASPSRAVPDGTVHQTEGSAANGLPAHRGPSEDDLFIDEDELRAFLDPRVQRWMADDQIPGLAFALVQDGEIVLAEGWGVSDLEGGAPVDPFETVFRIGSVSKALTGVAVSALIDAGRLGPDDPVDERLGDFAFPDRDDGPVTVRHVLTHTAGFDQRGIDRNFFDTTDPRVRAIDGLLTPRDRSGRASLRDFCAAELVRVRPSGAVSCYDTYGVCLAGLLLETVTGEDYAEAMDALVFSPLGMDDSAVEPPEDRREHLATGYGLQDGRHVPMPYEYYASLPASSIDSTVVDMAQLMIALLGDGENEHGEVLSAGGARRTLAPQYRPRPDFPGYTHLFWDDWIQGQRIVEHGGTMMGYSTRLVMLPELGVGFFVACNRDGETGPPVRIHGRLTQALMERWFPDEDPESPPPQALDIDTARFAGPYAGMLYAHTLPEGVGWRRRLHEVRSLGPGRLEFHGQRWTAVEPLLFVREDGRARTCFFEDDDGAITHRFDSYDSSSVAQKLREGLIGEVLGEGWETRPAEPIAAMTWRALERWEPACEAYESLAERRATDGVARYYAGLCALRSGAPDRASRWLKQAWDLEQFPEDTAVLLAATHALVDEIEEALRWIQIAVELGATPQSFQMEPGLTDLHDDPRFNEIVHGR